MLRTMCLVLPCCLSAAAQTVSVGAIGGTNLTGDVRSGRETSPGGLLPSGQTQTTTMVVDRGARRPILGLTIDYTVSSRWSVEFDALHRELKSTTTYLISPPIQRPDGGTTAAIGPSTSTLTSWEFPVLVKYRTPVKKFHPFVAAGPSFRPAGAGSGLSHVGIAAGGGVELKSGSFRISPTVRYTHWSQRPIGYTTGAPIRNQVEFLVGVDRPASSGGVSAFGKRVAFGVLAGFGIGKDFEVGRFDQFQQSERNTAIFGVTIEVPVSKLVSIEVDGLYRPLHGSGLEFNRRVRFAHLTWEFPVLLKYRIPWHSRIQPFLEGGPAFRAEGNLNLRPVSHYGGTVGAGVEGKWRLLKIAPALRYTHWGDETNNVVSHVPPNRFQVLVSFAF